MFNSLGQLLRCIFCAVAVSITQLPAPPSSLPNRSQQLWLQGKDSSKQRGKKKGMSRRCNRNYCFVRNSRATANTCRNLRQVPSPDRLMEEIRISLGERWRRRAGNVHREVESSDTSIQELPRSLCSSDYLDTSSAPLLP